MKKYVTRKRVSLFMPFESDKRLAEIAEEKKKELGDKKFSKNKLGVLIIESYLKEQTNV